MYKKILLINPFGIGDVLFTTPVISALKDKFPGLEIGYLCNSRVAPMLENNPYVKRVFVYDRDEFEVLRKKSFLSWLNKIIQFTRQIKQEKYDLAIDFSLNAQYGFLAWSAKIKERLGYEYKRRGHFLTHKIKLSSYKDKHIVEYYSQLLRYLGIDAGQGKLEFYLKPEDNKKAQEDLKNLGFNEKDILLGIIPGGGRSWGKDSYLKHWPVERFAQLADKIIDGYGAKVILMGDSFERVLAKKIITRMHNKPINIVGNTSIIELAALFSKMQLVIANDGGPLHIAVALGKKTVSFFGPVDPKVYGPYPPDDNRHIVLRKELECSPCYRNFRLIPCKNNRQCIETIGVKEAFEAVGKLLN